MSQQKLVQQQQENSTKGQSPTPHTHESRVQRQSPTAAPTPHSGLSHAVVQRGLANPRSLAPNDILQLQRTIGNQAVQRMLSGQLQRNSQDGFEAGKGFEQQLSRTKGGGSPLPKKSKEEFESSFGANFSNVRIHTGAESNQLNRSIQAKAFTHGNDIHFSDGEYNPASSQGKHLLAHELTHTIQQTGSKQTKSVQTKLQVGAANDKFEQAADHVAAQVTQPQNQVPAKAQGLKTTHASQERAPASIQRRKKNRDKQQTPNTDQQQINFNGQSRLIESDKPNPLGFQNFKNFQDAIAEMAVKGVKPVAAGQQPRAVMLMGAVGAGKSKLIPELVPDRSNFVHADADMVKEAIPEYRAGIAAGDKEIATKVHSKSKGGARGIADKAIGGRYNLLFDGSGGDSAEYRALMGSMRRAGYHITLAMTHISVDEGLKRVAARAQATGRDIPKDKVIDMYKWVPINFPQLVPLVDQAYLFDNMVPQGETPILIWESKDGPKIDKGAIDHLTELLANVSQKSEKDIQSGKVDDSDVHSPFKLAGNPRYLERDGWASWIDENHSDKFGLTTSRKEIRSIDKNLKKYDHYKAKNRGNAQEQAQLLFQMQSESKNSRYQSGLNKNTKTFDRRRSATSRLLQEIDSELKSNPFRLAKVSEAEQIKELTTVGFSPKFLRSILKLDLRLLYQAHAALAHHQTSLAQSIFDRLNPVQRNKNKQLEYNGNYIKRSRKEMFLPQQMLMAHHHQVIGGAYASAFSATRMDDARLQKVTNKYVRNKDFISQGTLDGVKNQGGGAKSLDELIADNTGLLPQEIEAIRIYTGSYYRSMNATLQDTRLDDPKAQKGFKGYSSLNQLAMSGLSKLPSYDAGKEVCRGDTAFDGMLATLRKGTLYQTPSFLSTTKKNMFVSTGGNVGWVIKVAPNSRGKDIQHLSMASVEQEVLFPPGTKLKITNVLSRVFSPLDLNLAPEHAKGEDESMQDYMRRQWQSEDGKRIPDDKITRAAQSGMRTLIYAEEV